MMLTAYTSAYMYIPMDNAHMVPWVVMVVVLCTMVVVVRVVRVEPVVRVVRLVVPGLAPWVVMYALASLSMLA